MRSLFFIAASLSLAASAFGSPESLERARLAVQKWVEAEKTISREEVEWEAEKVLLADLIAVAAARVEQLEAELAESEESLSSAAATRLALLTREEELDGQAEVIASFLAEAEGDLRTLRKRLPEPLQRELETPYQRLPEEPEATSLGLGERMQTVVAIANSIRRFDGRITVSESTRELPGQDRKGIFRTIWLGLGQAYYLAPDDAGYGLPGPDGWEWHSLPELRERIQQAILMAEQTGTEPGLVELPVKLEAGR